MSFNLLGKTWQEHDRVREAYFNVFHQYPHYYDLPVFDPDIYDTHITIILPLGESNFTDEDMIRIAVALRNLDIPMCGFNFHQHFLCFESIDGYYDMDELINTIKNYTTNNNLPEIQVSALKRPG